MKIRTDYVTNSSSSSFILAFRDRDDGLTQIAALTHKYGSDYVAELLRDFCAATPIPLENITEHCARYFEDDAYHYMYSGEGSWWSSDKDTFEKRWMDAHPGATHMDFYKSKEYKDELARLVSKREKELLEKLDDRTYIVDIEYEDHSESGSALEHDILPYCDFNVLRASHH